MSDRPEILAAPLELWLAPVGTAFPTLSDSPDEPWELIGRAGAENYTDDGVTIRTPQTIETFTPAGTTMPVKAWRTESGVEVSVTVADVRAETLRHAFDGNEITAGLDTVEMSLLRGDQVAEYALLARGQSPYATGEPGQFQVPRCIMSSDGVEMVFKKGEPAALALTFTTLKPEGAAADDLKLIFQKPAA